MKKLLHFLVIVILFSALSLDSFGQSVSPLPCINKKFTIVAHIIKDSLGRANLEEDDIQEGLDSLNARFSPICISFEICEYRYIDNFQYDNLKWDNEWEELNNKYRVDHRINIFFVKDLVGEPFCGKAYLGGVSETTSLNSICIKKTCENPTTFTLSHEMGHFFGLSHTFEDFDDQLVDNSDCETTGDGICDTPADPYNPDIPLEVYLDDCEFIFDGKDANGDFYSPDITNIMSYYNCACRFTDEQFRRMVSTYLDNPKAW